MGDGILPPASTGLRVTVVGIGEEGWEGLSPRARGVLTAADTVLGAPRQLGLLPDALEARARAWPSPMAPLLDRLAQNLVAPPANRAASHHLVLLASGSPMLHGLGASLAARGATGRFAVLPHLSTPTLACAELGWPEHEVTLVSACGHPVEALAAELHDGGRALVLSADETTPHETARLLARHGYGSSRLHVLERLGGPSAAIRSHTVDAWPSDAMFARLNAVAVEMRADPSARILPRTGLPDDAFDHDGQLTRRDARASALARLAPQPGALLWDLGAGSGAIGIEWCRAAPRARALGLEKDAARALRARANALHLGATAYRVLDGTLPEALEALLRAEPRRPDAIFLGGGATVPGLIDRLAAILAPRGRLVAHGVTLETEGLLIAAHAAHGGLLTRLQIATSDAIGGFTGMRPAMAVLQWSYERPKRYGQETC